MTQMKVFLVTTARKPTFNPTVLEQHFSFLAGLRQQGRIGLSGGFADQTGGAYILLADTLDDATALALADPLHTRNSSTITVREWLVK